jgi:hypothetical protein
VVTFLFMGVLPLLGGLYMGAIFFYGLTTQASVVAWVSVAGVALAFLLGALVVWRAAPTSEFFKGINERRQADRMGEPAAAEEAVSSQPEVS